MTRAEAFGRVIDAEVITPGRSALIAKNGWTCQHGDCRRVPTAEVSFFRTGRGPAGGSFGCHGVCAEHAEAHRDQLLADARQGRGSI